MPTFPYSVPKKIEEKFEEKVVLVPDTEHPLFKENNFGPASMNGELLSSQGLIGIAADVRVDIFQSIITFKFSTLNVPGYYPESASSGHSSHLPSSNPSHSPSLL